MNKYFLPGIFIFWIWADLVSAQVNPKDSIVFTTIVSTSFSVNFPGGDLVNRFGINGTVGGAFAFKTRKNWFYGINYEYIFGKDVKEWQILNNLNTQDGFIINSDGMPTEIYLFERGYTLKGVFGKISPLLGKVKLGPNMNSGIFYWIGFGVLQHRIHIKSEVPQLQEEYAKGYDRLSNGIAVSEFIGYLYLGNTRMINFYFGVETCQAWTKNRRGYNYDMMSEDKESRLDLLTGFRFGWVLPLYKKVPNEFYYN
ncbi:MAG TPA: hypothetical protein EYM84_06605 [Flavobacteriales bacterium]|nr:hypothetical protein [Flavobacteriales bacterium]HIN39924.1 hypothetical protein [Flavobacteriales bacterium]